MTLAEYTADRARLVAGETTAEALVDKALAAATQHAALTAVVAVAADEARAEARALDARRAAGLPLPPLAGFVLGVKDNIAEAGRSLSCGARMLAPHRARYTATAVARLRAAGALSLFRLNCDAFGMGSTGETSVHGPTRNPRAPGRVPGGSSSGSAAAVAAGFVHGALGSDTGGSVRLPAAFTGTVGLKPTYGRVSRYGLVAYASSFDCIGALARSVPEAAMLLGAMAGADPADATASGRAVPDYAAAVAAGAAAPDLRGCVIGVPRSFLAEGLHEGVRAAFEAEAARLVALGATLRDAALPHAHLGVAAYYVLTTAEASSNLGRYDGIRFGHRAGASSAPASDEESPAASGAGVEAFYARNRTEGFGDEVRRRVLLGTYVLSAGYYDAYYNRAQRVRRLIRDDVLGALAEADVLLLPTAPAPPFRLGEALADPLQMYLSDVFTVTASLAGVPALALPAAGCADGLPVGIQLVGRPFGEADLLRVGAALEAAQK
ncbi:MAG: amidase family protein [Rubricoccaceae bacterium]